MYMCAGLYFSGDGARRDSDGHYQITGRVDDVINVKGHRIGTAELESCLVLYTHCTYVHTHPFISLATALYVQVNCLVHLHVHVTIPHSYDFVKV